MTPAQVLEEAVKQNQLSPSERKALERWITGYPRKACPLPEASIKPIGVLIRPVLERMLKKRPHLLKDGCHCEWCEAWRREGLGHGGT